MLLFRKQQTARGSVPLPFVSCVVCGRAKKFSCDSAGNTEGLRLLGSSNVAVDSSALHSRVGSSPVCLGGIHTGKPFEFLTGKLF